MDDGGTGCSINYHTSVSQVQINLYHARVKLLDFRWDRAIPRTRDEGGVACYLRRDEPSRTEVVLVEANGSHRRSFRKPLRRFHGMQICSPPNIVIMMID